MRRGRRGGISIQNIEKKEVKETEQQGKENM